MNAHARTVSEALSISERNWLVVPPWSPGTIATSANTPVSRRNPCCWKSGTSSRRRDLASWRPTDGSGWRANAAERPRSGHSGKHAWCGSLRRNWQKRQVKIYDIMHHAHTHDGRMDARTHGRTHARTREWMAVCACFRFVPWRFPLVAHDCRALFILDVNCVHG